MRFGAFVPQGWRLDLAGIPTEEHWPTMVEVAKTAESSGFESVWVYDHFHTVPVPTQEPTYEAWTLMSALAVATDRARLGQMCTCNSYRQPSYLAKVAASVDVISGGRLEMGIGAGWYEAEYLAYGYPFPKPAVRIGQLDEACQILKRMWTEDEVHFEGDHYRLQGAICRPKPLQRPHIPLWVAGGGEQLTLRVAARYADYTNFGNEGVDVFRHKSEVLAGHCRDQGRDFDEITRTVNFNVVCAATEKEVQERLDWIRSHYARFVPEERAAKVVALFEKMAGTPEQLVERISEWREAGVAYAICYFPEVAYDRSGLELFGRQVVPALS
ncbi:MAG: LLM class F420-dependent oxidoreductase [Acidimicrobiia bacterium]|nr:MAG: LLM class F420-dependent oxidoreductase [Acidimicrobiia bacterium]